MSAGLATVQARPDHPTAAAPRVGCGGPRVSDLGGTYWCAPSVSELLQDRLRALGVQPGARVLVSDESTPALALLLVTLMAMDASIALLDPGLPASAVDDTARQTGSRFVVGPHLLGSEPSRLRADGVLGTADTLVADLDGRCTGRCRAEADRGGRLDRWRRRGDALLMWTSGSAGPPKGLVKSGEAVVSNVAATVAAMRYREDDVLLPLLPLTHQYGMSLVLAWWLVGCDLLVGNHRRPLAALRQALPMRPTVVDAVPPVFHLLLPVLEAEGVGSVGPAVRLWCVGGSPLSPLLASEFRRITGHPLLDGYGSSEAGNVALATLEDDRDLGRPLPGVELAIRAPGGEPCSTGELGEVWLRSPYLFSSYLGSDRAPCTPEGWYRSGDVGSLDEAGRLRVIGRASAVHRGGFTIYPASVELRAAAVGVVLLMVALPDERMGAHLTAVVEDPAGHAPRFWAERLRSELPVYEQPNRVIVVDAFPLLSNGKPDRERLTRAAAGARRTAAAPQPSNPQVDP